MKLPSWYPIAGTAPLCQACEENQVTPPYTVCVECAADDDVGEFLGWDDPEDEEINGND